MREMIAELEAKIRSNRVGEVHEAINGLAFVDIPRVHVAKMANLALRSGALFWAIRLLNPIVRSDSAGVKATAEELAEYGFALNRIGAHAEAERVLAEIAHHPIPRIQIYLAAIHANAWNYEAARSCFEKYLSFAELSPYERRIGRLNLASSLIAVEAYEEARSVLEPLREELAKEESRLLYGNTIELSAQLAVKLDRHDECAKWIEEGREIFPDVDSIFSLFFTKWRCISEMKRGGDPVKLMRDLRTEAVRLQHHETIREADFHLAIETADEALFNRVYFGTPWERYRARLLKVKPASVSVWEKFDFAPRGPSEIVLEVTSFGAKRGEFETKSGQLLHRTISALTLDLYRPSWVAATFNALFPNEFYHPESGPKRVHQAIFRLRNWFKDSGLPLEIDEKNGRYSLVFKEPCVLRLERTDLASPEAIAEEAQFKRIRDSFGVSEFGSQDAAKALGVSMTSAREFLKWAVDHGRLAKQGSGPKTRYKKIS